MESGHYLIAVNQYMIAAKYAITLDVAKCMTIKPLVNKLHQTKKKKPEPVILALRQPERQSTGPVQDRFAP